MSSFKMISKQLSSQILNVAVGEGDNKRVFGVHEELICESSEFFRSAMSGEWKEAEDRVVTLPDDDPEAFALYLQAIYCGHVKRTGEEGFDVDDMIAWACVYVLADKLTDVDVKDMIIESFWRIETGRGLWSPEITTAAGTMQIIYEHTPGPCGMRQLFVDSMVYEIRRWASKETDHSRIMAGAPHEFFKDVALAALSKKEELVRDEPRCACPGSIFFYHYMEKYLEGGDFTGKKYEEDYSEDECQHKYCCQCRKR